MKTHELTTPALVVEVSVLEANLDAMAQALPGARLRPHVKAHKCTALARLQAARGHAGFTCATVREMEGMAAAGLGADLLLANEVLAAGRLGAQEGDVGAGLVGLQEALLGNPLLRHHRPVLLHRDVEAGRLLVGGVAGAAALPEHRQRVVDERHLLLGAERAAGHRSGTRCGQDEAVKAGWATLHDQWLKTNSRELRIAQKLSSRLRWMAAGSWAAGSCRISRSNVRSLSVGMRVSVRR